MTTAFQARHAGPARDLLIARARLSAPITYGELSQILGLPHHRSSRIVLAAVGHDCRQRGEPVLTAMVVNQGTGRAGDGLEAEFGVTDDAAEREACHRYWITRSEEPTQDFARRAARFASVEVRPEQAAFRRAVFAAYRGRCPITGCTTPEMLDAAHLHGSSWREGQNSAEHGILMRADLHRAMDTRLITFERGRVVCDEGHQDLGKYHGLEVHMPTLEPAFNDAL